MFEKDAEEYGLQQALWCTSDSGDLRDAFKDGAEFGYSKGKNEAIKHLKDLVYVVELGKNELATARILAEVKEFLKETK